MLICRYYGQEFTYKLNPVARHVKHMVDIWCEKRKISHGLIPPGVKELNGKVERSHRIDMQYFYWKAPRDTLEAFNQAQHKWLAYYNLERLHGGIGFITPIEKLQERTRTLASQSFLADLELLRLKFLKSQTIKTLVTKQDRQIQSLEKKLTELLKKIA